MSSKIDWTLCALVCAALFSVALVIKDWGKPRPYACACNKVAQTK